LENPQTEQEEVLTQASHPEVFFPSIIVCGIILDPQIYLSPHAEKCLQPKAGLSRSKAGVQWSQIVQGSHVPKLLVDTSH
jgi:hypothetical protein